MKWEMEFDIRPCPAPRWSPKRDKWKPSPQVKKYKAFRDFIYYQSRSVPEAKQVFKVNMRFTFAKKKIPEDLAHRSTPDIDNLVKAVLDSLYPDGDQAIWSIEAKKIWGEKDEVWVEIYYTSP